MNTKVIEKLEKSLKYGDKELEICTVKTSDLKYLIQEYKEQDADLYEANHRITDLLLILGDRDRMINEMAKYIDDFQMECNKYYKDKEDVIKTFEERCK